MKKLVHLAAFLCLLPLWPLIQSPLIAAEDTVKLVKNVKPAVVLIQTFDANGQPTGNGSGFFINNKGHIITNHHVIEGAYSATVKTSSGREYPVEGIIAKDIEADIVKLLVNIPDSNIVPLKLSTTIPSEGEDVIVIGNPLGFESTVSTGIVSAVRDIPAFGKILQITAPVSPGSSGSPVVNSKGEVIGVATLIMTKGQNLNFAVPSEKIGVLKESAKSASLTEYLVQTSAVDVNDAQKLYEEGLQKVWAENWLEALICFKKATHLNPHHASAWFQAGYCYCKLGRYIEAIEADKQAIKANPDNADAHNNLGFTYAELGRYQDAIEAYKQAITIKPDYDKALYNLGVAYFKFGRYQDAIETYKQFIKINPTDADAHYDLGAVYLKLGHYQDAAETFKQAIRIQPDLTKIHFRLGLGFAYGKLGHYQDEIEVYKQAIKINPDFDAAHFALGTAYLKVGDKSSALAEYKILKTLDAGQANILFNMIYK